MSVWKTLSSKVLLSRKPYLEVIQQEIETDRGQIVPDFYRVELGSFAICVPFLPSGEILTLRAYKHGAGRVSTTFPAGRIDEGERADQAMARELLEETGYRAKRLVSLGSFIDDGNQVGNRGHYFAALDCEQIQAPDDGDLEIMEPILRSPDDIEHAIRTGEMPVVHHVAVWYLARAWQRRGDATT